MITGYTVAACAQQLKGIPFKHQGRNEYGLDCAGLIIVVARRLGLSDFDYVTYGRQPNPSQFLGILNEHTIPVSENVILVGSILSFAYSVRSHTTPQMHLGIALPDSLMIHALAGRGVIESTLIGTEWEKRLRGVWQYKGVLYG